MIAPAGRVRTGGKSGSDEREFGGQGGWGGVDWLHVLVSVIGVGEMVGVR